MAPRPFAHPQVPVRGGAQLPGALDVLAEQTGELIQPSRSPRLLLQPSRRCFVQGGALPAEHALIGDVPEQGVMEAPFGFTLERRFRLRVDKPARLQGPKHRIGLPDSQRL